MSSDVTARERSLGLVEWFRPGEHARVHAGLGHLRALEVSRLRTGVSWADWVSPGGAEWYAWLLPTLRAAVEVLPCLHYTPPSLAVEPRTSSPPRDLSAFARFVEELLAQSGDCVEHVELWNEPNNLSDWDWRLDPGWNGFAEMVTHAAAVAKQAGKRVVLGGMCPIDGVWLARMRDLGVLDLVDVVGVHGFPGTWEFDWQDWGASLRAARAVLAQQPQRPALWITETGYSTWGHDEHGQIEALLRAADAPVERVYWSALQDLDPVLAHRDGFHVDERHYHLGLVGANGAPKLAYRLWSNGGLPALEAATHWLRPHRRRRARPLTVITGGAGFIGTNLAERLLAADEQVLIYDNLSRPGVEHNLRGLCARWPAVEVQVADVRNKYQVARSLRHAQHVFHLAAQVAVTSSLGHPLHDFEVNAAGTVHVLEAIRARTTPPTLVFTSTNKVYGGLTDVQMQVAGSRYEPVDSRIRAAGIDEQRPLDFHSPYGCSKGAADQYVLDYARSYRLPALVFRMSCIYGPHQCGTEDQGWVAHFVRQVLARQPLVLYGDGLQVRDLLYVDDLIAAFLLARARLPLLAGRAFNMGGGAAQTTSLLELIALLSEVTATRVETQLQDWRTGDQRYYVSNTAAFTAATDWHATVTVEQGVRLLAAWLAAGVTASTASTPAAHALAS